MFCSNPYIPRKFRDFGIAFWKPTNICSMCTQLIHLNTKSSVKWAHEFIIRVMWWICDSNVLLVRFMAGKNTSVDTSWRFLYLTPPSPATSVVCRFMTGWPLPWHETRGWLSPLWRIIGTLLLSFRPWTTTQGRKELEFCLKKLRAFHFSMNFEVIRDLRGPAGA